VPPPPSDPVTPNEHGPGTPNSTTTSLSALSVVAIKDGSIGHGGRGAHSSANTLEAERADRISRLAGLERVATVRATPSGHVLPGGGPQYDSTVPHIRERSTVGSASATGSVGGKTTWASESINDPDKMSEDQEDGNSSVGGYGDEDNASLVGFGEGANSTVSGPVSTANARMLAARQIYMAQNQNTPRTGYTSSNSGQSNPMSGTNPTGIVGPDPKMMDGMTYDTNFVDTTMQNMPSINQPRANSNFGGAGTEMAESIMRDRIDDIEPGRKAMSTPDSKGLGKCPFEQ
jgi:hypothetical protein